MHWSSAGSCGSRGSVTYRRRRSAAFSLTSGPTFLLPPLLQGFSSLRGVSISVLLRVELLTVTKSTVDSRESQQAPLFIAKRSQEQLFYQSLYRWSFMELELLGKG